MKKQSLWQNYSIGAPIWNNIGIERVRLESPRAHTQEPVGRLPGAIQHNSKSSVKPKSGFQMLLSYVLIWWLPKNMLCCGFPNTFDFWVSGLGFGSSRYVQIVDVSTHLHNAHSGLVWNGNISSENLKIVCSARLVNMRTFTRHAEHTILRFSDYVLPFNTKPLWAFCRRVDTSRICT